MIIPWSPPTYPSDVLAGDIVFIAGVLPINRDRKLPFEHVAVVAQAGRVNSDAELLDLYVYGLPESVDSQPGPPFKQLFLVRGRYWLETYPNIGTRTGSKATVWNMIGREEQLLPLQTELLGARLALLEGTDKFGYEPIFNVDPTLLKGINTNCMGFVCSIFESLEVYHLTHTFPAYDSPYRSDSDQRTFPSPGHLAYVLNSPTVDRPYCPSSTDEAKQYARADETLNNVAGGRQ